MEKKVYPNFDILEKGNGSFIISTYLRKQSIEDGKWYLYLISTTCISEKYIPQAIIRCNIETYKFMHWGVVGIPRTIFLDQNTDSPMIELDNNCQYSEQIRLYLEDKELFNERRIPDLNPAWHSKKLREELIKLWNEKYKN